jgi:nitrile hydratase accessory protein
MEDPVFAEPWQASAFAMTVALHERGLFTWNEWAEALGAEVKSGDAYYDCWLRALEKMLAAKAATSVADIERTAAAWKRAAQATPHGQPILLANDPAPGRPTPP